MKNSWLWCNCWKDKVIMSLVRVVVVMVVVVVVVVMMMVVACCELRNLWTPNVPHITAF
jgi:hypothetical protein